MVLVLKSPGPTSLFLQLSEGKEFTIGSGSESELRLPGTALKHFGLHGIDQLKPFGQTEVTLNGTEITDLTPLSHGDMIVIPNYKLVYLDPAADPAQLKENQKTNENSNTESCEEEIQKSEIAKKEPIAKENRPPVREFPQFQQKQNAADQMWRRKVEEVACEKDDDPRDSDRPVVPLCDNERPISEMGIEYYSGMEQKILRHVSAHDPECGLDPLLPSTLISMCFIYAHQNFKSGEIRLLLSETKGFLKNREAELVGLVEKFRNDQIEESQNCEPNRAGAIGLMMARIPLMFQICYWASNTAEIAVFWKRGLEQAESDITSLYAISQR